MHHLAKRDVAGAHTAYFDAGHYKRGLKGVAFGVPAVLSRLYWHCQAVRVQPNKLINFLKKHLKSQ